MFGSLVSSSLAVACLLHATFLAPSSAAATAGTARHMGAVTDLVIFGDSYTDSCNVWRSQSTTSQADREKYPFPSCPPAPTGRADGGNSWPEWIRIDQGQRETKGAPPGGKPFKKGQWNVENYAQSGATCDNRLFNREPVPDVLQQIHLLKTKYNTTSPRSYLKSDPSTSVAAMWIGTNDLGFFLKNIQGSLEILKSVDPDRNGTILDEISCTVRAFNELYDFGYRRFVLLEAIPLQYTVAYGQDKGSNDTIEALVQSKNALEAHAMTKFESHHENASVEIFPTYHLFKRMYLHPEEYGFNNVTGYCYQSESNKCDNPDQLLWQDSLHPGNRAEHILAKKLVRFLEGDRGLHLLRGREGV
ncbi:hypothetical protein IE53DRAFT_382036 [Violaceomyces palustris]|uniref:Uncharacterized protein n=1 Tax=Violaceomyces palustris TaxID=1673888 RepID=A0ACD0NP39_9BASI|nr:hypothetical protein IE53DRAFT_382036 [Violaceomyces palustris]